MIKMTKVRFKAWMPSFVERTANLRRPVLAITFLSMLGLGAWQPATASATLVSSPTGSRVALPQPNMQPCKPTDPDCGTISNPHAPTISWTAVVPANSYVLPTDTLTFGATAADQDTYVATIDFFIDDKNKVTFNGSSFQTTVSGLAPGSHTAVAVAWDSQGRSVTTDHVPFTVRTSVIAGNIDGVSADGVISGWACSTYLPQSISVDLYLGGPYGTGTGIGRYTANVASEPGVASACGVSGGSYRFSIPLTSAVRVQFGGQRIYLHGISPVGAANSLLGNSGNLAVPMATRDAQVVSQTVASTMQVGTTQTVNVQMRNTGNYTWSAGTGFKLGAVGDSTIWGPGRVTLPSDVAPGQTASFTFNITAPAATGTYTFQWQMLQEGVTWFGAATPTVGVSAIGGSISANPGTCSIPTGNTSCASTITWSSNSASTQVWASNLDGSSATVVATGQGGSQSLGGITTAGRRFTLKSGSFTLGSVDAHAIPGPEVATTVSIDYDELGRVIARRDSAGQVKQSYKYDANGNLISTTDALNHTQSLSYDALGRVATTTDADQKTTSYTYDAADRVILVVDPRNNVTSYDYDGFGQRWRQVSPDSGTTSYTFDANGLLQAMTRANGVQTTYAYDGLNRVVSRTADGLTQHVAYDSCSNGAGRICRVFDAVGATSYSYTPEGEIGGRGFSFDGTTYALGYAYDSLGRMSAVLYPDGNRVDYTYSYGLVASATLTANGVSTSIASGVTYRGGDASLSGWISSNGLTNTLSYDADGRLTAINVPGVQSLAFGYDEADHITRITNGMDSALTQTFQYDNAARLISATSTANSETFSYDANGNRVSHMLNGVVGAQSIDPMSNRVQNADAQAFGYDANGNLTTVNGVAEYHFDPFNRMDASPGMTSYVNLEGQRLRKTGAVGTTWFASDRSGRLLAENAGGGWVDYLWLNGRLIGRVGGGQVYAIHSDQLGRPESVTNAAKSKVWLANNLAFDRQVVLEGFPLELGFPGQYYDAESNVWNNGYRDYRADLGRYLETDPIGLSAGPNTYTYVGSAPVTAIDPLGLCKCSGPARILKGNSKLVGKGGGFDVSPSNLSSYGITADSAAVIPSQFGMTKPTMRSEIDQISGTVDGGYSFARVRDVVDDADTRDTYKLKSTAAVQKHIMDREAANNGGTPILILELQGIAHDLGVVDVVLDLPDGSTCPTGLK
ncbi:MAG: RHS repeat-associated core domain-containing protein [Luteibacter sp.]